ncbi:MAG: hypothetical protein HY706_22350, partial [Candidatus Hydrogenedentes bacterium]|nr:hypothetical protein [Candidatus Hydrogenedentota bacterium]
MGKRGIFKVAAYGLGAASFVFMVLAPLHMVRAMQPPPPSEYTLTVTVQGSTSGTVTPSPNPPGGTAPATPTWTETCVADSTVQLTASPASGKVFDYWSGAATGGTNPTSVIMNANKSVTANFAIGYPLTTSVQGQGTVSPTGGTYKANTSVYVTATPESGWRFDHWTGDASGSNNPVSVYMSGPKSVTAVFTRIQYTLTTAVVPTGGGTVSPASGSFDSGSVITLTATPAAGKLFDYWSESISSLENPVNVTMDGNKSIIAWFAVAYTLTTSVQGEGTVSPSSGTYKSGSGATISANPASGWQFNHWEGGASGTSTPVTITMNGNKSVTAVFTRIQYTLTTSVSPAGSGTVSPSSGSYDSGSNVQLTAAGIGDYQFGHWEGGATGTTSPVTVNMNGNKSVTAYFVRIPRTLTTSVTPAEGGSVNPSGGTYDSGTTITLTANANSGWQFLGWADPPELEEAPNPAELLMDSDKHVDAWFVRTFELTTSVEGSGSITVDNPNQPYADGTQLNLTAQADSGWRFDHWEIDLTGSTNPAPLTMDSNKTVKAVFIRTWVLTIAAEGPGSIAAAPDLERYDDGTVVTVTATPIGDGQLKEWQGPVQGSDPLIKTVTMNSDITVTAVFTYEYYLTATVGSGEGTVTGSGWYARNTNANVSATGNGGWVFSSWTGDVADPNRANTTVYMDANKQVSASFGASKHLHVAMSPPLGAITFEPGGKNNPDGVFPEGQAADDDFAYQKQVQVTINTVPGYEVANWEGDFGGSNPVVVSMDDNMSATAIILPTHYDLTINVQPQDGGGTVPPPGTYSEVRNTEVTITEHANEGFRFVGWSGSASGTGESVTVVMNFTKSVTATFCEEDKYALTASWTGEGSVTPAFQTYNPGETATVTATAAEGWRFVMWQGGLLDGLREPSAEIVMYRDQHVHAIFTEDDGKFWLQTEAEGEGTVSPASGPQDAGTPVTLTAQPGQGSHFVSWEGDDVEGSTEPSVTITMDSDKYVRAIFAPEGTFHLRVRVQGRGHVDLSPSGGNYAAGTSVTLTAEPEPEAYFIVWRGDDVQGKSDASVTIVMNEDKSVTAVFTDDPSDLDDGGGSESDVADEDDCQKKEREFPEIASKPIHGYNGEEYLDVEDMRIKGRGMDFVWTRNYRSRKGKTTTMGHNWDFGYNLRVERHSQYDYGRNVKFQNGRGGYNIFSYNSDSVSWRKVGLLQEIRLQPNYTYVLLTPQGITYTFRSYDQSGSGRLSSIRDRNGNEISFSYGDNGRLSTITDTLGRQITVSYNAEGQIAAITDFTGRSVQYAYYGENEAGGGPGDLKSVTTPPISGTPNGNDYPQGKTTVYTYTTGNYVDALNHNLLTITDPRNYTRVTNTYGSDDPTETDYDRVVRQEWGGGVTDLVYVPQNPETTFGNAVIKTIVNDRMGNVREYFYDIENRGVIYREYTGRAPDPRLPTTETDNRPTGKLRPTDEDYYETRYTWNADFLPTVVEPHYSPAAEPRREYVYERTLNPNASPLSAGNLRTERRLYQAPSDYFDRNYEFLASYGCGGCSADFVTEETDENGFTTYHTYDANGNRIQTVHPDGGQENFEYNNYGQVTAHVWPDNGSGHRRRDTFVYWQSGASNGYLRWMTLDTGGAELSYQFFYDPLGNVNNVVDPTWNATTLQYNALDQVVEVMSRTVSGNLRYRKQYHYDWNDNLMRVDVEDLDASGQSQGDGWLSTNYEYDPLNYLTRIAREMSPDVYAAVEFAYDDNRNLKLIRSPEGALGRQPDNVVQIVNDELDRVWKVIQAPETAAQSTTQFDYVARSNHVERRIVGLEGILQTYTYGYDEVGRLVSVSDPMGNGVEFNYDDADQVVWARRSGELADVAGFGGNVRLEEIFLNYDPMGRVTRLEQLFFDPATQGSLGDGASVLEIAYTAASQIQSITNDRGFTTQAVYDTANRLLRLTDALGNQRQYTYDANSNVVQVTETHQPDPAVGGAAQQFTVNYSYDGLDRVVSVTDGSGNVTQFTYDSRDNVASVSRPMAGAAGIWTLFTYDGLDRVTKEARILAYEGAEPATYLETNYGWDHNSRVTWARDGNGNETQYTYDNRDQLTRIAYADGTQEEFAYDLFGNLVASTDANGTVITSAYDALNRLTGRQILAGAGVYPDTTWEAFGYDGLSRLVSAQDDDSTAAFAYDSLSDLIREVQNGRTIARTFDGEGNPVQTQYPGGATLNRTFDALDRLLSLTRAGEANPLATYRYVGPDRVQRREYSNGTR